MATQNLGTARWSHTATLLPNGQVLVAGGIGISAYLSSAELYDPATGTWTATNSLATARAYHTATLLVSGDVLVAGGLAPLIGHLTSAELYDSASGTWTTTGSMSLRRDKSHGDAAAQWQGVGGRGSQGILGRCLENRWVV